MVAKIQMDDISSGKEELEVSSDFDSSETLVFTKNTFIQLFICI